MGELDMFDRQNTFQIDEQQDLNMEVPTITSSNVDDNDSMVQPIGFTRNDEDRENVCINHDVPIPTPSHYSFSRHASDQGTPDRLLDDQRTLTVSNITSPRASYEEIRALYNAQDRLRILGPNFYDSVLQTVQSKPQDAHHGTFLSNHSSATMTNTVKDPCEPSEAKGSKRFDHVIATADRIEQLQRQYRLPNPKGSDESINQLRYGFFSAYRRIFSVALIANLAAVTAMIVVRAKSPKAFTYAGAATATGVNLTAAVVARHEHFINILFRAATALPYTAPLCIRRHAAKVYSYGGVHSGAGFCALLWYIFFAALLAADYNSAEFATANSEYCGLASITAIILTILLAIVVMSHPHFRIKHHDAWEWSHRFGGWFTTLLVWVQTFVLIDVGAHYEEKPFGLVLIANPMFWMLLVITYCLVYPWVRLRKREVQATQLSDHALKLSFSHKTTLHHGMATRISDAPLKETHGFAVIPADQQAGESGGFECIVSNAGDWTRKMIQNPKGHVWVKGTLGFGALNVVSLFKPVVVVATGSGIAPVLSFLRPHGAHSNYPVRVLWSARYPEDTYGADLVSTVIRADPEAVIIDTKKTGIPNMTALAYALHKEGKTEAVMIISNGRVTREVVYGLESRGVPAFGAIFDS